MFLYVLSARPTLKTYKHLTVVVSAAGSIVQEDVGRSILCEILSANLSLWCYRLWLNPPSLSSAGNFLFLSWQAKINAEAVLGRVVGAITRKKEGENIVNITTTIDLLQVFWEAEKASKMSA